MDPNFVIARVRLGVAYERKLMQEEAIAQFKQAVVLSNESAEAMTDLAHAYAVFGKSEEAYKILNELQKQSAQKYVSAYNIAEIYTALNEKDQSFARLQKACIERSWYLAFLRVEPRLDRLRSDPRFADLERCVRFKK